MAIQELLEQYGLYGVMLIIALEFVTSRIVNSRARLRMKEQAQHDRAEMEKRIHNDLEMRHQKIVSLMNAVIDEKQVLIDDMRRDLKMASDKIFTLEVSLKKANERIDALKERAVIAEDEVIALRQTLITTESVLATANKRAEKLAVELEQVRVRLQDVESELAVERGMRVKAEERVQNLEAWNDRANADNTLLIRRVDMLTAQVEHRTNRILSLETQLEQMRARLQQINQEANGVTDQAGESVVSGGNVADGVAGNGDGTGGDDSGGSGAGDGG